MYEFKKVNVADVSKYIVVVCVLAIALDYGMGILESETCWVNVVGIIYIGVLLDNIVKGTFR